MAICIKKYQLYCSIRPDVGEVQWIITEKVRTCDSILALAKIFNLQSPKYLQIQKVWLRVHNGKHFCKRCGIYIYLNYEHLEYVAQAVLGPTVFKYEKLKWS